MGNRVVFDTNLWVSYFMKGDFTGLVLLVKSYEVEFVRCPNLTKELINVLNRKKIKQFLELPIDCYISFYENLSTLVHTHREFTGCRDPKDNYLFDLAIQSNADYLVSGDPDVRETETEGVQVVSITKFKEILRNKNNNH